ncbi:MAG TPA: flagellar export protein FliJ [Caulobacteraceae bacterium]
MSWRESLVRLAGYEVEQLRKRLLEILDRRAGAELKLTLLHAEAEGESLRIASDAEAGWYRLAYLEGWRARRDGLKAEIEGTLSEEAGARDALARAFEELKKYEQIQEDARLQAVRAEAKLETAAMDELGLRRAGAR